MAIGQVSGKFRTHTASTPTLTPSSPLCGLDLEVGAVPFKAAESGIL